jgi:hypothetical protein
MTILGFPVTSSSSTAERPTISNLPPGGLFMAATPEFLRELEEKRKLVDYVEQRFVHFVEPEVDSLH